MLRRFKHLSPFALASVVVIISSGILVAQTRTGSSSGGTYGNTGGSSGSNSFGLGSGSTSNSSSGSFGLNTNVGFGTTQTNSSSSNSYGSTSLIGPYLGNPLATGISNQSSTTGSGSTIAFGSLLYNVSSTSGSGSSGGRGGRTGGTNTGTGNINRSSTSGTATLYTNTTGAFRTGGPSYVTRVSFVAPRPSSAEVHNDLRQAIAQASDLPSRNGINLQMDGDVVVLQGKVTNPEERRVVELLVRMNPAVRGVRNELVPTNPAEE